MADSTTECKHAWENSATGGEHCLLCGASKAKPTPKPCEHHYVNVGTIPIATVVYECIYCGDYYEKDVS
jgi:hypothetical protein